MLVTVPPVVESFRPAMVKVAVPKLKVAPEATATVLLEFKAEVFVGNRLPNNTVTLPANEVFALLRFITDVELFCTMPVTLAPTTELICAIPPAVPAFVSVPVLLMLPV